MYDAASYQSYLVKFSCIKIIISVELILGGVSGAQM